MYNMSPTEAFLLRCQLYPKDTSTLTVGWGGCSLRLSTASLSFNHYGTSNWTTVNLPPTALPTGDWTKLTVKMKPGWIIVSLGGTEYLNMATIKGYTTGTFSFTGGQFQVRHVLIEPIVYITQPTECAKALRAQVVFAESLVGSLDWANVTSKPALVDSVSSTNTALAATANSVKWAYDNCVKKAGDTINGSLTVTGSITEGGTTLSSKYASAAHHHDTKYSAATHNHDGVYAPAVHTHTNYAPTTHKHDDLYAPITHTHTGLVPGAHTHTWADTTGTGLLLGDMHNGEGVTANIYGLCHANVANTHTGYALLVSNTGNTVLNASDTLFIRSNHSQLVATANASGLFVSNQIHENGTALADRYCKAPVNNKLVIGDLALGNVLNAPGDASIIAHANCGTYGFAQTSTGAVFVNAAANQAITFLIDKSPVGAINKAALTVTGNIVAGSMQVGDVNGWSSQGYYGLYHKDVAPGTGYALLQQNTGDTFVNANTGKTLYLRIGNQDVATVTSSGLSEKGTALSAKYAAAGHDHDSRYLRRGADSTELSRVMYKKLNMLGGEVVEFGYNNSGKEQNAGKIGYATFDSHLDIVGAGTSGSNRTVKIYDYLYVGGTGYSSDGRLKKNIASLGRLLDKVDVVEGKTFDWDDEVAGPNKRPKGKRVGLIAQELQAMCPDVVHETDDGLAYDQPALNGVLIQLVKDLRSDLGELKGELGELRSDLGELRSDLGELKGEVEKLRKLVTVSRK